MRLNNRSWTELRPINIALNVSEYAEGSCLIEFGKTKVFCTATFEKPSPKWLQGSGSGWVTAEYGMLPRATHDRVKRERSLNSGRTQEIARLIGRSLRSAVDLKKMGECQIVIDCDVISADGGTRTASVTGGYLALALALKKLELVGEVKPGALTHFVSAVSIGIKDEKMMLDLDYEEDSSTHIDMNFVMNNKSQLIEIQGTAEQSSFSVDQLVAMTNLASQGCTELIRLQKAALLKAGLEIGLP